LSREIKVEPLTRVEGHGNVIVRVNVKDKSLKEVELNIVESPRFFERFLVGKPAEEAPRISQRICGICFADHHLASVKAVEAAWDIAIPEIAVLLRKALHYADIITSHMLHVAFLCLPDLVDGLPERSFTGLLKVKPELVKLAVNLHSYGNQVVEEIGGRIINPVTAIPGGMSKPLTKEQKDRLLAKTSEALKDAEKFASEAAALMEQKAESFKHPVSERYYVGLVRDGWHELYDGELKVVNSKGETVYKFNSSEYLDYVAERISPHSFVKLPYLRKLGFPAGIYRVGPLARLNTAEKLSGTLTQKYLKSFEKIFGKPSDRLMAYNMARIVEVVNSIEAISEILSSEQITSENVRVKVEPKSGIGVGIVEAPRGILIHHYETSSEGILTNVNIISPTTSNAPSIETDLRIFAENRVEEIVSSDNSQVLWEMETLVRAYDPCISCATHLVKLVLERP
jgi:F420-non-reducing hydrogenase large subunit